MTDRRAKISLPPALHARVKTCASALGMDEGEVIRRALRQWQHATPDSVANAPQPELATRNSRVVVSVDLPPELYGLRADVKAALEMALAISEATRADTMPPLVKDQNEAYERSDSGGPGEEAP